MKTCRRGEISRRFVKTFGLAHQTTLLMGSRGWDSARFADDHEVPIAMNYGSSEVSGNIVGCVHPANTMRGNQTTSTWKFMQRSMVWWVVVSTPTVWAGSVCAQPQVEADAGSDGPSSEINVLNGRIDADRRATQIKALIAGTLDPNIDVESLFVVDLASPAAAALVHVLLPRRVVASTDQPVAAEFEELARTQAQFLRLSESRRRAILARHAKRRETAQRANAERKELKARLLQERTRAQALRDLLSGEGSPENQRSALRVNLLDRGLPQQLRRLNSILSETPKRVDGDDETPTVPNTNAHDLLNDGTSRLSEGETAEDLKRRIAEAEGVLDALRRTYLALSPERRAALGKPSATSKDPEPLDSERAVQRERSEAEAQAAQAAAERERALEVARRAQSEARRLVAQEYARLLGIRERQAHFGAELASRKQDVHEYRETALSWKRKVREITQRSLLDEDREFDADRLYGELVPGLRSLRSQLKDALSEVVAGSPPGIDPGDEADAKLPDHVDARRVRDLRQELLRSFRELATDLDKIRWDTATELRDGVVSTNHARLTLLEHLSEGQRSALRGFGAEGVRQAKREVEQITLEARFHLLAFPRHVRAMVIDLKTSPVPLLGALFKLGLLFFLFRGWRRRADSVLDGIRKAWLRRRPQTPWTRGIAISVWYVKRIRRPAEWLVFFWVLSRAVSSLSERPEIRYLWIVLLWTLVGGLMVRFVDSIAARQSARDETANLRFRSLRLIGISVVAVGLVLALTDASVGRGALYHWVLSTCWMIAVPIFVLLVSWWRPVVLQRAKERHNPAAIVSWVAAHDRGLMSYLATGVGGLYLLGDGLYRFALRQASHLTITQRFLAYLFRREVEKTAEAGRVERVYGELSEEAYRRLGPDSPCPKIIDSIAKDEVAFVGELVNDEANAVVAVVGERGLGKTMFLKRVAAEAEPHEVVHVSCRPGGFARFRKTIAETLGLETASSVEEVADALRAKAPKVVCVDDAQRLIRPLIGGLRDIDQLTNLARLVGGTSAWVVSIDAPAWQYLRRARGERAVFGEVIRLKKWTETQISELVRSRATASELAPRFDDLVVPRQIDVSSYGTGTDHTERDYCRILWDYAKGNPAVALHFWRESLGMRDGEPYVRLFRPPSVSGLEDLPSSVYFVLRAMVQLGLALESDIVECTHLDPTDVADALRLARSRRYVEKAGNRQRVTLPWYRAVTQVLQRRHLLTL